MDAFDKAVRLKVLGPYPEVVTPTVVEEAYKKFSAAFGSEFPINTFEDYFKKEPMHKRCPRLIEGFCGYEKCEDHVLHWYLLAMYHNPLKLYKVGAGGAYG